MPEHGVRCLSVVWRATVPAPHRRATPLLSEQACAERIKNDTTGQAHCSGQYFDFWKCVDHCVSTPDRASLATAYVWGQEGAGVGCCAMAGSWPPPCKLVPEAYETMSIP